MASLLLRMKRCYRLTPQIPDKHAALVVEVFSIGFHACNRSGLKAGDSMAIWGTGRIGHSILQAARTKTDNTIFLVDILDNRLKIAAENFDNVVPINRLKQDPIAVIKEYTKGCGVDIAFEAVGHAHVLPERPHPVRGCIQCIRGAGTVCVLGLADDPAPLIMKELIWRAAKIFTSRVSHGEFAEAIHNLSQGNLKPDCIISLEVPASEAQSAFELLENEPENYIKVLLWLG